MDEPIADLLNVDDMDVAEAVQYQPLFDEFFDEMARSEMTSSSSSCASPEDGDMAMVDEEHVLIQMRSGSSLKTMMMCFILIITAEPDQSLDKERITLMCQRNDFKKRRVYDVVNILMTLGMCIHVSKGLYKWLGRPGYNRMLEKILQDSQLVQHESDKQDVGKLAFVARVTFHAMVLGKVKVCVCVCVCVFSLCNRVQS